MLCAVSFSTQQETLWRQFNWQEFRDWEYNVPTFIPIYLILTHFALMLIFVNGVPTVLFTEMSHWYIRGWNKVGTARGDNGDVWEAWPSIYSRELWSRRRRDTNENLRGTLKNWTGVPTASITISPFMLHSAQKLTATDKPWTTLHQRRQWRTSKLK